MAIIFYPLGVVPLGIGPGFSLGTPIEITLPVTSRSTVDVKTRLIIEIWEGRYWVGDIAMIATYTSAEATIAPDATENFVFPHTVVAGPNYAAGQYRRDLLAALDYWTAAGWARYGEFGWEDVYHVAAFVFEVGPPTVAEVT